MSEFKGLSFIKSFIKSFGSFADPVEVVVERHFREMVYRFSYWVLSWMFVSLVLLYFSGCWLQWFLRPLPAGRNGVFLSLWGNVHSSFKISAVVGFLGRLPFLGVQIWLFFARAMRVSEQKVRLVFFWQRFICAWFSFFLWWNYLLPRICVFCLSWSESFVGDYGLSYLPEVVVYLDLALRRLFALLVRLQLFPLLVSGLAIGLWRVHQLGHFRRLVYFRLLIFATVVSPPDVGSQLLLVIPLVICFELSIFAGRFFDRRLDRLLRIPGI